MNILAKPTYCGDLPSQRLTEDLEDGEAGGDVLIDHVTETHIDNVGPK